MRVFALVLLASAFATTGCAAAAGGGDSGEGTSDRAAEAAQTATPVHEYLVIDGHVAAAADVSEASGALTLRIGALAEPVTDWIQATLANDFLRKSGQIVSVDAQMQARSIRDFSDAVLTEVDFPTLDGSSNDGAALTLKLAPASVRHLPGDGAVLQIPPDWTRHTLRRNGFHFTIDGLEATSVTAIGPISIQNDAGSIRISHWTTSVSDDTEAAQWLTAASANPAGAKRHATLTLGSDPQSLLTVQLAQVGIFNLTADPAAGDSDKARRANLELGADGIDLGSPVDVDAGR